MKSVIFISCLAFFSAYAHAETVTPSNLYSKSINSDTYRPIQPINFSDYYKKFDHFKGENSTLFESAFSQSNQNKHEILKFFPNESSKIYVEEYDLSGNISYGVATVSKTKRLYHITIDYLKYRTDEINGVDYVSGVGLRMKAKINSDKNGIDLSNLFAIAAAASENKISGSLEFDSIGISGPEITPLVPVPSSLSIESISASIQALAAIKSKIYTDGDSVYIWPQVTGTVGGEPNNNRQNLKAAQ